MVRLALARPRRVATFVARAAFLAGVVTAGALACGARTVLDDGVAAAPAGRDAAPVVDARVSEAGHADAARDAAPEAAPDAASRPCPMPLPPGPGEVLCLHTVRVTSLQRSSPTCFVDVPFKEGDLGTLRVSCDGDGSASLVFGATGFGGAAARGEVDVCNATKFLWTDGCTWTTAQRARGSLRGGRLAYRYDEHADGTGCLSPCWATAELVVVP